ncbi:signal peptide peptidase-like 2B isoform X2 [Sagmatias obliquidens]|nr:signal peptide peptidase-like 2B isoform X2 [Lagenorhynchus obliquidens]XP_026941481.1 signal peptide peptidase-like 2B isoform X2 [Lagenorhynchus obliquidens]XP_026941482.1 signal peptide peptidase-like 2B isoform X2 [Lagenorhynchus obliquidens]XP_026941483.1 signal peptide peptidase-like 2B isoform X2 [Lagenorhynchus obliquidens]XP_026941484.1 signal peptide peptidase-like 2B isoform X2 [Lagenorhynchus obliquidens]XP_026941485.1 signal peptide peptidase-like 2B isoform X2 [Lagenorhynchus 
MVHVVSETGGPKGKDYCILYNPQWAHLPLDLSKASLLQVRDWTTSVLCSPADLPAKGFSNQIPLVARGNCTFYEKVRLAQGSGARGLLIISKETLVPPGGNKTQYDEIGIPVALLSYKDMLDIFETFGRVVRAALYAPKEPMLDYNMVIIFIMAVGTVALGGYWAGSRDVRKRYMKHKRDDGPEKHEDEAVDVTPVMICVFVVMCCSMLVLLYHFYDQLVYVIIGIFCLASSTGLYSCLSPLLQRLPFCRCRVPDNSLPYFHKRPQVRMLLLALLCVAVSVVWGVFRNEDQWAWILQDALGIAFCLYTLKTIRLPTFKACTLLLLVLFIYDVFFVFITPFLTKSGNSIMVEVATGPSDSATHEKLPMVLKVPRLNASPLALCDRPFSLLGFGDILVPGLLVAYCHRFDIQVQSSRVYFVACTIEGPTSVAVGASLCRRPAAPGGLRRRPLPAASRPRSGPVPSARGAAPRVVGSRRERGRRAPPGARESGRPRPRPLGLGEGADSAPAPRDWTRAAPNLVLWPGRCTRPAPARPHPGPQPCSELAWLPSPRPAEANPARAPRFLRRWCPGKGGAVTFAVGRGHAQFGACPAAASLRVRAGRGRVSGSWWRGAFAQQGPQGFGLDVAAALGARGERRALRPARPSPGSAQRLWSSSSKFE